MHANRMRINRTAIESTNFMHLKRIESYRRFLAKVDGQDHTARREAQECVMCFGESRIGGAALTARQCAHCDATLYSGNTNVDVLCVDCARRAQLCKHCGADIDLKNRRKRTLPTEDTE